MGTPVLTVPASKPPTKTSSKVCHGLCCQVHWSRRCHRRCRRVRSWNWLRLRLPHHRIRQEPLPEAAAVLLRHSWLCPLRGHGTCDKNSSNIKFDKFICASVFLEILSFLANRNEKQRFESDLSFCHEMGVGQGAVGVRGEALVEFVVLIDFDFFGGSCPNGFGIINQIPIPCGLLNLFSNLWFFFFFNGSIFIISLSFGLSGLLSVLNSFSLGTPQVDVKVDELGIFFDKTFDCIYFQKVISLFFQYKSYSCSSLQSGSARIFNN